MFTDYGGGFAPRSKASSLAGSVAIHLAILLFVFQIRSPVEPPSPRYAATQLYAPAAERIPAALPRAAKLQAFSPPALPLLSPPRSALLTNLPAPAPKQPAFPELPVTRAAPVSTQQPVLPSTAPALPTPPSPVFASALPPTLPTAHATTPRTGAFAAVPLAAASAAAKLQVPAGTFGTMPAATPHAGTSAGPRSPAGFGAAGVVAGVAAGEARSSPRGEASAGASNGFGAVAAVSQSPAPRPAGAATAFKAAVVADPVRQPVAGRRPTAEPLEILFKPRPGYTEAARRERVEGDVVLEVLFNASGSLRVLRVMHGLGYGLEQNASDAAGKIRFRPAREDGHAVDTVAMVRISFQLAY